MVTADPPSVQSQANLSGQPVAHADGTLPPPGFKGIPGHSRVQILIGLS
jgi:hypothetical protein